MRDEGTGGDGSSSKPDISPQAKLGAKKFNKRLDLIVNFFHASALAVLGLGGLRYVFDMDRAAVDVTSVVAAVAVAFVLELVAQLLVSFMRSED